MNYHENNSKIIQKKLYGCLDKICRALHIQIDEWDVDHKMASMLSQEILSSKRGSSEELEKLFDEYDRLFDIGKALNLETELRNYSLFTNLTEINNTYGNH